MKSVKWWHILFFLLAAIALVMTMCFADVQAQTNEIPDDGKIIRDPDPGGGDVPGGGGGSAGGQEGLGSYGPWLGGFFTGGVYIDLCNTTDSDISAYGQDTGSKFVWTSSLADSGHVRWDEAYQVTWNYVEEAGDDSTSHYVSVTGLTADYTHYHYQIRTGSDECYSDWSEIASVYTNCGDNTIDGTYEDYDMLDGNRLRVDPTYKNLVQVRYKKTLPVPDGDWTTGSWLTPQTAGIKVWDNISLDASSTYTWEYRMSDPCADITSWTAVGTFTTDGSGHIN